MKRKIEEYLNYEKITNGNEGTADYNETIANYLLKFYEQNRRLKNTRDLVMFYKVNTELSNNSINKIIKLLRQVHNHHNMTNKNLFDFKLLKETPSPRRIITRKELVLIFNYVNDLASRGHALDYHMMTYILFDTGVRPNELLNIEIKNINLKKRYIFLEVTKTGIPRRVYFSKEIAKMLKEYLETNYNPKYLFYNNLRNRQYTRHDLRSFWRRVKAATGIEVLNTYMFRHTYITEVIDMDVPLVVVQNQAGHADISTTMIYYHNSAKVQEKYLKPLERTLKV